MTKAFCRSLPALLTLMTSSVLAAGSWREATLRATLTNKTIEAQFQAGLLCQLKDCRTGRILLAVKAADLPVQVDLFDTGKLNLDDCTASQQKIRNTLTCVLGWPDGTRWTLRWAISPGSGDLILHTAAEAPKPVGVLRIVIPGFDIAGHSLVTVGGYGTGSLVHAPWKERFEDPAAKGFSPRYVHPLVALFEGKRAGWFLEGRDPNIGPANLFVLGQGRTADLIFLRGYPKLTQSPVLYEIRFRTYAGAWCDAVDPYLDWMERGVGYVPIDRKPQSWVRKIRTQAYVDVGDFQGLEALARRLDPAKTLLGRMAGFSPYPFDSNYPDYSPSPTAVRWFRRARELGFHVGVHINTTGLDPCYPDLIERFKKGFLEIRKNAQGKETWEGPPPSHDGRITFNTKDGLMTAWGVPPTLVYSTAANEDWRHYLTGQLKPLVDAGVDMIYLDESMGCCGKFLMGDTTAIQGVMALEREILDTYPHAVIETEEINPMNARWSSFALTTLDLGHPLGGYLFHRFAKIVPEGAFYEPVDESIMDQFQSFGFLLPGASKEESWLQIAEAFQRFDLQPAPRLTRKPYQLSGWEGPKGVTAFFEKHPGKRGLVVYEPGRQLQWFGTRITGVREWPGPGALPDWAVYRGNNLLSLDPKQTYVFDPKTALPQEQFHVTRVPDNFVLYTDLNRRLRAQEMAADRSFYKITFTGTGEMEVVVPGDVLVFLDGEAVQVDRQSGTARVRVAAPVDKPSVLLAFRKSDRILEGKWVNLPWQTPPQEPGKFVVAEGDGFFNHLCGSAQIIGRLPRAKSVRLKGSWGMSGQPKSVGDAVVRINGREVLRLPPGEPPFKQKDFDADVSAFVGQYVLLQFSVEGRVAGFSATNWYGPQIVADREAQAPAVGNPGPGNAWKASAAVQVRASSSHARCVPAKTVDGSGFTTDGKRHVGDDPDAAFVTGSLADSRANPRGGTAAGSHWIEFEFDRVYSLGEMWVWNYHSYSLSYDWRAMGFRDVTIQYSTAGGQNAGEWTTIYRGAIPTMPAVEEGPVSLTVDFAGAKARYVVITTADPPNHNWSNGKIPDAGLSAVRFYLQR